MKFYKIMTPSNVENSNLKLPENFENRFKDRLKEHVTIDVPSGAKWKVEVEKKSDNGVWFKGEGWIEFVESLGLKNGHFLMFEFDEMSDVFHVIVMGMDGCEIKYPFPTFDQFDRVDVVPVPDSDDDLLVLSETPRPIKKRVFRREDKETILDKNGAIQRIIQGRKVYTEAVTQEAEQALARAKAFKATEPVFIVALQPTYLSRTAEHGINKNCNLLVPRNFIMTYFDLNVKNVILETRDERIWKMLYRVAGGRARFTCGWKEFAEEHKLIAGDVCLFELNREATNALNVSIFRTNGVDETYEIVYNKAR